jgi:hypothetical protein
MKRYTQAPVPFRSPYILGRHTDLGVLTYADRLGLQVHIWSALNGGTFSHVFVLFSRQNGI